MKRVYPTQGLSSLIVVSLFICWPLKLKGFEEPLLSQSSAGYAFIESMQEHYCKKRPSHSCQFDPAKCRADMQKLWRDLFNETPSEENLTRACARISTRFELPGVYSLLSDLYLDVARVAPLVGLDSISGLHLGSLPIREVNARALPPDPSLGHFALFNIRFFEFANEIAKVSALPIPIKAKGEVVEIDGSQEALEQRLNENSELSFLFVNRLMHFLELEGLKPALPPKDIQTILIRYQRGTELFALAHEYAHIALRHVGQTTLLEVQDVDSKALGISGQSADWVQELEADYFAARAVRMVTEVQLLADDWHIADYLLPLTPDFYFLVRQIVDDATNLLFGNGEKSKPTKEENRLLALALGCIEMPGCKLAVTLRASPPLPAGHPHPSIRRAIVSQVLSRRPTNETDEAMQALASQMTRNATHLWARVEAVLRDPQAAELLESIRQKKAQIQVK